MPKGSKLDHFSGSPGGVPQLMKLQRFGGVQMSRWCPWVSGQCPNGRVWFWWCAPVPRRCLVGVPAVSWDVGGASNVTMVPPMSRCCAELCFWCLFLSSAQTNSAGVSWCFLLVSCPSVSARQCLGGVQRGSFGGSMLHPSGLPPHRSAGSHGARPGRGGLGGTKASSRWAWVKMNPPEDCRCSSMFPFARVAFWVPIFDSQMFLGPLPRGFLISGFGIARMCGFLQWIVGSKKYPPTNEAGSSSEVPRPCSWAVQLVHVDCQSTLSVRLS